MQKMNTRQLTGLGIFTAIVVVLQFLGAFIKFGPFSISLTLIPIVVVGALYGMWGGAWLGFVFSVVVLISGDAAAFLAVNPLGTILVVLTKGTAAGLLAGWVYQLLTKKGEEGAMSKLAAPAAAVTCPVVNTGIFLIGCVLFFMPTVRGWAEAMGFTNVTRYMFIGLVGGNFLFELALNLVLSPVIVRLIQLGQKK